MAERIGQLAVAIAQARGDFGIDKENAISAKLFEFGQIEAVKRLQRSVGSQNPTTFAAAGQYGSQEAAGMISGQLIHVDGGQQQF